MHLTLGKKLQVQGALLSNVNWTILVNALEDETVEISTPRKLVNTTASTVLVHLSHSVSIAIQNLYVSSGRVRELVDMAKIVDISTPMK